MARVFNVSGRLIDHGSAASLDDLPVSGILAVWAWIWRLADGTNQHIITKRNAQGWVLSVVTATGEGALRLVVERNTTDTNYISNTGIVALNTWTFVGAYFNDAATPKIKLFWGTPSTDVAEVGSYTTSDAGSGSVKADAASNLYVGNIQVATTLPFLGMIQRGGVIQPASTPDATYFEALRVATATSVLNVAGTKLLFDYQDGDLSDRSGNGNNGTATGATTNELLAKLNQAGLSGGIRVIHGPQYVT